MYCTTSEKRNAYADRDTWDTRVLFRLRSYIADRVLLLDVTLSAVLMGVTEVCEVAREKRDAFADEEDGTGDVIDADDAE